MARVVYGAADPRSGYTSLTRPDRPALHPSTRVEGGLMADECVALMRSFFASKR
jgi:tRNA(adenine34) deaminase